MSLGLGDIDKAVVQGLVDRIVALEAKVVTDVAAGGASLEDHAESDAAQLLKPLIEQAHRMNDNFTALIILLTRLLEQGIIIGGIPINLQPPKTGA